jgi:SSS family solute:Na+ symporter
MLQLVVPIGIRGLFLAALFGAIQSTVNAVLNSTATLVTLDIYKRMINKDASEKSLVSMGVMTSSVIIVVSIIIAWMISTMKIGLFMYVQNLYSFFAPPFAAVFLLGILFKRINAKGATVAIFAGFIFAISLKLYLRYQPDLFGKTVYDILYSFNNQAFFIWLFCVITCTIVSLITQPPKPQQVTDELAMNWRKMNIFSQLGDKWYTSVILWWGIFAACIISLVITFSQIVFRN